MKHLDLELERLEQRIAPGLIGMHPCGSRSSKTKGHTKSKSKSKSKSRSKSKS